MSKIITYNEQHEEKRKMRKQNKRETFTKRNVTTEKKNIKRRRENLKLQTIDSK